MDKAKFLVVKLALGAVTNRHETFITSTLPWRDNLPEMYISCMLIMQWIPNPLPSSLSMMEANCILTKTHSELRVFTVILFAVLLFFFFPYVKNILLNWKGH